MRNPRLAQVVIALAGLLAVAGASAEDDISVGKTVAKEKVDLNHVDEWLLNLSEPARRGYQHLTESIYLPADLDEEVFATLGAQAVREASALPDQRGPHGFGVDRAAAFQKYGLTERPGDDSGKPLQYVIDESQTASPRWVMNCFACHGGSVYGQTLPGAPNNLYQLQLLTEDVRSAKLRLAKPLTHMDIGSLVMPLGSTVGTTNAVMFGVALMNYRDAELNVRTARPAPRMVHHDMDPPAWWLFHRKRRLYADGFAEKGVRGLMQFMLVRENGPDKFKRWEQDFEDIYAYIESVRPPAYPSSIDAQLAERGRLAFNAHCARCHGTTASTNRFAPVADDDNRDFYPEKLIDIDEIGTDRVRLESLTSAHRQHYGKSWFAHFGDQETWAEPRGYMAPPLDGIWASPPYFHNGSVPTLWHVLHPDNRPQVWRRTHIELDSQRVGLTVAEMDEVPEDISAREKRYFFDTRSFGKGNQGHEFPNQLTEAERLAVLEYLKTL